MDALNGLTVLNEMHLSRCAVLQNVDGLQGLTGLTWLDLTGSTNIPAAALRELRAALPKTHITFPDGSNIPPP